MKFFGHLKTVTHHRWLVMVGCFRMGLIWRGLTHDLSKFSPTEFLVGARYYQGNKSPNGVERQEKGYSKAWMHHKGRNRHHYEYWTDFNPATKTYTAMPMPRKYLAEMVADRIAACKTYQGKAYTDGSALAYFMKSVDRGLMHATTRQQLEYTLTMLQEKGEKETFRYLRRSVLKGKPFPWEETDA